MLELKLHQSGATTSPSPDVSSPDTEVWRDEEGAAVAYGGSEADRHWMLLPGVGVYVFGADAAVEAFPDDAVLPEIVEDGFRRIVLPMALQVLGREVLHASAVQHPAGVVALCAVSGTGKSTLAHALSGRGHRLWADDAVVFELVAKEVRAVPLPFTLRLAGESSGPIHEPERASLAAIALLERAGAGISIERMTPAAAFPAVLTHAYCFTLRNRNRNAAMLESYLELVQRVPVLAVSFPGEAKRVPEIAERIEQAVDDG